MSNLSVSCQCGKHFSIRWKGQRGWNSLALKQSQEFFIYAPEKKTICTDYLASAQVVETSVTNNSPSQDSNHQMISFNQGMLLLASNHFLIIILQKVYLLGTTQTLRKNVAVLLVLCMRETFWDNSIVCQESHYVVLMNYFNNILLRNCLSTYHYKFKEVCISFIFKVNIWGKAKIVFNPRPVLDDACLISWYSDIKTCIVLWKRNK